jgi:uncharacterized repeat protein (TIGR03803 family)
MKRRPPLFNSLLAGAAILFALPSLARAADYAVVHAFPMAEALPGKLLLGRDGASLFGTTVDGGQYGNGALFRVALDGSGYTVLHSFRRTDPENGASPTAGTIAGRAGLVQGADGTLYGTTQEGGLYNFGTIYKIQSDGSGWQVIHSFAGPSDGAIPYAGLLLGRDGMLYGTASQGGLSGDGTVFRMAPGQASSFQVIHQFDYSDPGNGVMPFAGLVQGPDNTLYGTTWVGGPGQNGVVFSLAPDGSRFTLLHAFGSNPVGAEGPHPSAGVVLGADGFLYGTTIPEGTSTLPEHHVVFKLSTDGATFSVVRALGTSDGQYPLGGLIQGADGALYGTTASGSAGYGTLFRLTTAGAFSVLHTFAAPWGADQGVVQAPGGTLYGSAGNPNTLGAIFRVSPSGTGYSLVHSFVISEGNMPAGGVILGVDGALYGTTIAGGNTGDADLGTVFKMNTDGSGFAIIHAFDATQGAAPTSALVQRSDGTLFGTTTQGGPGAASSFPGVVYTIAPDGTYRVLHGFTGPDGSLQTSYAPLLLAGDGSLYGTSMMGSATWGEIFHIAGDTYQTLYAFPMSGVEGFPSSIIWGPNGRLFGLTVYDFNLTGGGVFSLVPTPGAQPTFVHEFNPATEGGQSRGPLVLGKDGALYGTTSLIGDFSTGTVLPTGTIFKLQPDGTGFQVLYVFSGGSDGATPVTLMQGRDGRLYGTTYYGGESDAGTMFALNTDGTGFTVLHSFEVSTGANPYGALLETVDGSFYGVALSAGPKAGGVVYRMSHVTCPGTPMCSGHGSCSNGVCACQSGYSGTDCSLTCPGGPTCSGHGTCNGTTCTCSSGYSGTDCSLTCPGGPTCSGHGTCNGTTCTCQSGYTGASCSTPTCPGTPICSGHGTCSGTTCTCSSGYTGADCSTPTCPGTPVCSGHGTCSGTTCTCNSGYTGASCSTVTCPGTPVCSGHGTCSGTTCTCSSGYTGADCSTPTCPGTPVCSGHGTCNGTTCTCSSGYTGPSCSTPTCPGTPVCSGHGTCNGTTCTCSAGYTGSDCSIINCTSGSKCPNNATCSNNNNCASYVCQNGRCQPPGCSPHCNNYASCGANSDCGSQVCTGGTCAKPACSPNCGPAAVCGDNGDCYSRTCSNNLCVPPSCSPTCNQGATCGANSDCGSKICTTGTCRPPTCSPNCAAGAACGNNTDCRSKTCTNYLCR